jgi:LysM repeat protein
VEDEAVRRGRPERDDAGETDSAAVYEGLAARAEHEARQEAEEEAALEAAAAAPDDAPLGRRRSARRGGPPRVPAELMEDLREVRVAAAAALGDGDTPSESAAPASRGPSAAVLAATLFLIGSALLSVSFMFTRGNLDGPGASPSPSQVAIASPTPPAPTPSPSTEPTSAPSPSVEPTLSATPSLTPNPLLALLEPCPDKPDCYIYTVKTDDSLARISRRFRIPVDTILELNPWITDANIIHPGDKITLPPPG